MLVVRQVKQINLSPEGYLDWAEDDFKTQIVSPLIIMTTIPLKNLERGQHYVVLTPDDIITLKLLRDEFKSTRYRHKDDPNRNIAYYTEQDKLIDTLERILKQVV